MHVTLSIRQAGVFEIQKRTCDITNRMVFGRDLESAVRFAGPGISREHFALSVRDGTIYIEDLSSNGTCVNGHKLTPGSPKKLKDHDSIEIPEYDLEIFLHEERTEESIFIPPSRSSIKGAFSAGELWKCSVWELVILASVVCTGALVIFYLSL
jgi:pSer/pThr/pTyr-binding forkhead associated (FHA) protein